jgi:hypothetical protein
LKAVDKDKPEEIANRTFSTLSDHYWLKNPGDSVKWEDVSFFRHDPNPNGSPVSEILLEGQVEQSSVSLSSRHFETPSDTLTGVLAKRWDVDADGNFILIKGDERNPQSVVNEEIATKIADILGYSHVVYDTIYTHGCPHSVCKCFTSEQTELIPANVLVGNTKKDFSYIHVNEYIKSLQNLGIDVPTAMWAFAEHAIVDSLLANRDRHLNNFGFLRDADTLNWLRPSPIFDSGECLWKDHVMKDGQFFKQKRDGTLLPLDEVIYPDAKPFVRKGNDKRGESGTNHSHNTQLQKIAETNTVDLRAVWDSGAGKLHDMPDFVNQKLKECTVNGVSILSDERRSAVVRGFQQRIAVTDDIINGKNPL